MGQSLRRQVGNSPDSAEWREMYTILFPLEDVPSPYKDDSSELESLKFPSGDTVLINRFILRQHAKPPGETHPGPQAEEPQAPETTLGNDSGYGSNSNSRPGLQLDKLHEVVAAEAVDTTDSITRFSETPSLLNPILQEYASVFAEDLAKLVPKNADTCAIEKLFARLPDLLKEFAISINFDGDTSHHQNLMHFVYKYNSSIVQHVREKLAVSFDQNLEDEVQRDQGDVLSWTERIAMLFEREQPEGIPDDVTTPENEDVVENTHEDANEDPESLEIAVHRDVLARSSAYEWLVARVQGELRLEVPGTLAARDEVRDNILEAIGRPKLISRKVKKIYHKIEFDLEWDFLGFYREQAYEESPGKVLEGAITITGSGNNYEDSGPASAIANCWKGLFRNPVVVLGYPILRQSQADTGLEIPLAMVARLVNAQTLVDFCGRTFLKGFSAMVAVTEISAQAVIWHLFHNEYGSRISYEDPRVPQISDQAMVVDTTQLETGRHILGWCGDVENYAGAPDANYDVEWSRLSDPDQSCAFQNVSISGGKFINAGFNLAIGIKDKPAHINFAPDDYIGTLIALEKRHFVFCDVEAKRSWLINGTNALLHLLRAALKDYENNRHLQRLNLLLLDRSKLQESEEMHTNDAETSGPTECQANLPNESCP
ncbi:pfs domain-containing protein [Colletotrichum asianum]|uniref:Pfs domain-containing protein n=1 Tax=Colletotrichum asianum TaxID=702518 RepID=A0A8H3ZXE2_9PEZI|nr:pfs domain-containing protein [Colletotrichum asianum]